MNLKRSEGSICCIKILNKIMLMFMKKILLFTLLFVFGLSLSYSQIPPGYYDNAIGLSGEELQIALHEIIDDHIVQE